MATGRSAIGLPFFFLVLAAGCVKQPLTVRPLEARIIDVDGSRCAGAPLHLRASGCEIAFDALIDGLLEARVVYVGEQHDSREDHRAELAIAEGLFARDPSLAIGLEMFERGAQPALDAYVSGTIDEATLLARTDYEHTWGFDYGLLRPIMAWARAHRVRVIGLNAPRALTRAIARGGVAALSPGDRASLPDELVLDHPAHRAMVMAALAEHPGLAPEQRERFYEAQVAWDEAMGASVAEALDAGVARRMVVFAGAMHVRGGLGIPRTAARRGADPYRIVLPLGPAERRDRAARPGAEGAALADEPAGDYLWVHPEG
jgi:uncharacterized iron-regulated protein